MKKYVSTILVAIITFIILVAISLAEYALTNSEKIIFIIAFSIVTAFLFHYKNKYRTSNKKT